MQPNTIDDAADALRRNHPRLNERRLSILECLRRRTTPVTLSELAAAMTVEPAASRAARRGTGATIRIGSKFTEDGTVCGDDEQLRVKLHHVDLPLLDDLGFLEYDADRNVVSPPDPDRLFA